MENAKTSISNTEAAEEVPRVQENEDKTSTLEEYGKKYAMGEEIKKEEYESTLKDTAESFRAISPILEKNFKNYMKERRRLLTDNQTGTVTKCSDPSIEFVEAVRGKICSMSSQDGKIDPEIEVVALSRAGIISSWSRSIADAFYKYGSGDFIFECLGLEQTPYQIARLVSIMKTIPSSSFAKFENMRTDAIRIEHVVIDGRGFIHDSAPEAHTLLKKMVEYYDSQQDGAEAIDQKRTELHDTLQRLRSQYGSGYKEKHEEYMFDLANYDREAAPYKPDWIGIDDKEAPDRLYDGNKGEAKAIDILRQLVTEMEPVSLTPPKTKDEPLNKAFERLGDITYDRHTGIIRINIEDMKDIMPEMNRILRKGQGKREMYPSTISAVAFVDLLATHALKNLSKKDWQRIIFDPTFKEIVRFSQMTSSIGYSEDEFESFYDGLMREVSKAYGADQIDDDKVIEGYKMLSKRIADNAGAVASKFSKTRGLESMTGAVRSGNLAHELIGLYDIKTA